MVSEINGDNCKGWVLVSKKYWLTRSRWVRTQAAMTLALVGALVMSGGLVMLSSSTAGATTGNEDKFFVCKYTAKPVIGEAAHHVISVDDSALVAGDWFKDGQSYSYVLEADDGQDEPDVSECPPYSPPGVIAVPDAPSQSDPCGPGNATWNLPADTAVFDWSLVSGVLSVDILTASTTFPDGTTSHSYGTATDSGAPCPPDQVAVPGAPSTTDPCGPANISFVVPADTGTLDWTLLGNGNVTVAPQAGFVFAGNSQLVTFTLPADSGVPCTTTVDVPGEPSMTDPCGPANISFVVPADTGTLDWTLLGNGNVTVAPQAGYVFAGNSQLVTFTLPADSDEPCIAGVEEIAPAVSFADPTCAKPNRTTWSGNLTDLVDYTVSGAPGRGKSITVTAGIKSDLTDEFAFPEGYDNTFEHSYPTLTDLQCVKGSESVRPKPEKSPTVLGTSAVAPTAVDAGLSGTPAAPSTTSLLAQLMVAGGLLLLLAGGWIGLGRREHGAHQA